MNRSDSTTPSCHHRLIDEVKRVVFTTIMLTVTFSCRILANGDPVVKYSSINRVANPEPLSISEIRIVNERVNITHADGYNCFDITYLFKNESDKDFPEIHYGFPIDYLVSDEQESYIMSQDYYTESKYETGWCDNLIKEISFLFNDSELNFHSAKESVRKTGYIVETYDNDDYCDTIPTDAVNRRWFYTQFAMGPQSEAVFNVRYKVYAGSTTPLYEDFRFSQYQRFDKTTENTPLLNHPLLLRYFGSQLTILYDFTPAKHFGNGGYFPIDVDIDLSAVNNPYIRLDGYNCFTSHLTRHYYVTNLEKIEPIYLTVYHSPERNEDEIERVIAPFIIPSERYNTNQSAEAIEFEFTEPTFVSELVCDIDTAVIKSINSLVTYADEHMAEYSYNLKPPTSWDNKVYPPVILTITDFVHDCTGDFENRRYKIKKIKLRFEPATSVSITSAHYHNCRLLDSRLNKSSDRKM